MAVGGVGVAEDEVGVGAAYSFPTRLAIELISAPQSRSVGSSFSSPAVDRGPVPGREGRGQSL